MTEIRTGWWYWRPGILARNTAFATAWQSVRLTLQFAYLILVARVLGVEGYGIFAGSVALAASLSPLVGWGFGMILVQEVSRSPQRFPEFWAKALRAVAVSGPVMASIMLALAPLLLPVDGHWTVILLIAAAELLAMPLIVAGSVAFQAHERLGWTMFNHVQLNLLRLGAVALLAALGERGLIDFAWAYFGATAVAALLSLAQVNRAFGNPDWTRGGLIGRRREGLVFSLSVVANTAHGELDKTLLLRLGSAAAAGNYSLANRVVAAATTPLVAYVLAMAPRLFRVGVTGVNAASGFTIKLLLPILAYGVFAGCGIFVLAPLLPVLFGDGFLSAIPIVRALAALPLLVGISSLLLAVLTCGGAQRVRVVLEVGVLIFNVALNLILIPMFDILGSVGASLASQFTLAVMAAIAIFHLARQKVPR